MKLTKLAPFAIYAAALMPISAYADELSDERIKELVYEAILENPQIIMEAVRLLEERQQQDQAATAAAALETERDRLEQDPNAIVLANPDGDVTVVEFFDYNCPYCRRSCHRSMRLLNRIHTCALYIVNGPFSEREVCLLPARPWQLVRREKYEEFHVAMMEMQGRAEEASVLRIAREVGLDIDQLRRDMEAPEVDEHIQTSMELTRALGFSGTPSFVIGDALIPGFVEADVLIEQVGATREAKNQ